MRNIIAIHMEVSGSDHLEHIAQLRWVETGEAGSTVALSQPKDATRAEMFAFVRDNPDQAYAISTSDNKYAFLKPIHAYVQYVKTLPDSTVSDNLLSLPRF